MRNRRERQYVGKDDSMTDMTDITVTSDIFSGHYETQIILFLVTVIVVTDIQHIILELFGIKLLFTEYGNNFELYQFVQYSHHY